MSRKKSPEHYAALIRALRATDVVDEYGEVKTYHLTGNAFTAKQGYDLRTVDKLTPSQKGKITRYFNALSHQINTSQPTHVYRARSESRKQKARELTGLKGLPAFQAVFVQTPTERKPRIRETAKGALKVYDALGASYVPVWFDKKQLALNAALEIREAIQEQAADAKAFKLMAGSYVMEQTLYTEKTLAEDVVKLQGRYSEINEDGTPGNHHWQRWMHGVLAFHGDWKNIHAVDSLNKELAEKKRTQRRKERERFKKRAYRAKQKAKEGKR